MPVSHPSTHAFYARSGSRVLTVFLLVISFAGCSEFSHDSRHTMVLNRGLNVEPESLEPQLIRSVEAMTVSRDLGEGLLSNDADGSLIEGVASRWEISNDGLVYIFHLRPDARWSNGDSVSAHDFVFAFRRLVDPKTAAFYGDLLSAIENASQVISGDLVPHQLGVAALDDRTLRIRLHTPKPYFLQLLTHPATFPVHRQSFEKYGDLHSRAGHLVSNGAYKLDEWVIGSYIALSRNEFYRDNGNTAVDTVRYMVVADPLVELQRYRAGELHITGTVPPSAFRGLREERPNELRVSPFLGVYYYGFNMTKPPFADNPELRKALSMAVDREMLVETVIGRGERPAYGWVPPGIENYTAQGFSYAKLGKEERESLARDVYRKAGYGAGNPLSFELRYNTGDFEKTVALAIQSMWKNVLGAEAVLINEEFRVLLSNIQSREITQLFRLSWIGDYNDADTFLQLMKGGNPSNMTGYRNSRYDELMNLASVEIDPDKRRTYLEEAEEVMLADHPAIPLYFYINKHLVRPDVVGWENNIQDIHLSRHLRLAPVTDLVQ